VRILVDPNILLDVLARREPFYAAAAAIWSLAERGEVRAVVSAISFNNVYYIVRRVEGRTQAQKAMRLIRDVFEAVPPDSQIINQAIDANMADFEDAVQFHSAIRAKATYLVTRNPGDFPKSALPILTPEEFLAAWRNKTKERA
jgi:predicted nucleic acid-binding protein